MTTFLLVLAVVLSVLAAACSTSALLTLRRGGGPKIQRPDFRDRIPLRVRRGRPDDPNSWSVVLGDIELANHIQSGGLRIEFEDNPDLIPAEPTVTIVLAPGANDLDIDADIRASIEPPQTG
jgi:hypothetical protein